MIVKIITITIKYFYIYKNISIILYIIVLTRYVAQLYCTIIVMVKRLMIAQILESVDKNHRF